MATVGSPVLSDAQLATLAAHGEERTAATGDTLFEVGDRSYPFMAILEGEAAVLDSAGEEIVRHGPSGFIGEMNLLTGQTPFLTAVATQPMRYIAVDRDELRPLLFEDAPLADLLLSSFISRREMLQSRGDVGLEILGPRSSADTRRVVDYAKRARRSTWSWSAGAPRASAPRSTAPRRGSRRSSSKAPRSAARPARRGGSRTTSASRPASAARS